MYQGGLIFASQLASILKPEEVGHSHCLIQYWPLDILNIYIKSISTSKMSKLMYEGSIRNSTKLNTVVKQLYN